jgi:poly(3-hydroxybutyrate) depolymerase
MEDHEAEHVEGRHRRGEWLIANGYTSRDKLSIYGGSAGGIFVGRAITERPDLFGAAAVGVGNTDSCAPRRGRTAQAMSPNTAR